MPSGIPLRERSEDRGNAADLFRQEIIAGIQVRCSVSACHILYLSGNAVGQVKTAHFHKFKVFRGDEGAARHGSLHADDLAGAAGPACHGRNGYKGNDGSKHNAQDAVNKSVIHFHNGFSLLICAGLRTGMFYIEDSFRLRLPQGGAVILLWRAIKWFSWQYPFALENYFTSLSGGAVLWNLLQ